MDSHSEQGREPIHLKIGSFVSVLIPLWFIAAFGLSFIDPNSEYGVYTILRMSAFVVGVFNIFFFPPFILLTIISFGRRKISYIWALAFMLNLANIIFLAGILVAHGCYPFFVCF